MVGAIGAKHVGKLLARLNLSAPCFSSTVLNVHTLKLGVLTFVRYVLFTVIAKLFYAINSSLVLNAPLACENTNSLMVWSLLTFKIVVGARLNKYHYYKKKQNTCTSVSPAKYPNLVVIGTCLQRLQQR